MSDTLLLCPVCHTPVLASGDPATPAACRCGLQFIAHAPYGLTPGTVHRVQLPMCQGCEVGATGVLRIKTGNKTTAVCDRCGKHNTVLTYLHAPMEAASFVCTPIKIMSAANPDDLKPEFGPHPFMTLRDLSNLRTYYPECEMQTRPSPLAEKRVTVTHPNAHMTATFDYDQDGLPLPSNYAAEQHLMCMLMHAATMRGYNMIIDTRNKMHGLNFARVTISDQHALHPETCLPQTHQAVIVAMLRRGNYEQHHRKDTP